MQAQMRAMQDPRVRTNANETRKRRARRARPGRQKQNKPQLRNLRSAKGQSDEDEWLRYDGAAKLVHKTPGSLRFDVCVGKLGIPYYKVGRKVLFRRSELLAWLQSCKRGGVQ